MPVVTADGGAWSVILPPDLLGEYREHQKWLANPETGRQLDWSGRDLCDLDFRGLNLCRSLLYWSVCRNSDFNGSVLRGASMQFADLRGASFRGVSVRGADMTGVDLRGADTEGTMLGSATVDYVSVWMSELRGETI